MIERSDEILEIQEAEREREIKGGKTDEKLRAPCGLTESSDEILEIQSAERER